MGWRGQGIPDWPELSDGRVIGNGRSVVKDELPVEAVVVGQHSDDDDAHSSIGDYNREVAGQSHRIPRDGILLPWHTVHEQSLADHVEDSV